MLANVSATSRTPGWMGPDRGWTGNVTHFSLMQTRSNQPPSARAGRAYVLLITREIQIGIEWAAIASVGPSVTRVQGLLTVIRPRQYRGPLWRPPL